MRSVLITGGAGFIGQNLVHAWRAARPDDRLTVIDAMTYAANLRSLDPLIARGEIRFVKGDINDAAMLRRLFEENRFTRVAHLAAESHVDRSIDDPEAFLNTNVLCTFRPTRCMARSIPPMRLSRSSRPIVPTRPMPRARPRAIISCARLSRPTECRH